MNLAFDFEPQKFFAGNGLKLPVIEYYDLDTERAPETPRGPAYKVYNYQNGIMEYETHRKSCISVRPDLAKKIPAALRKKWYFELDGAYIALFYLYQEFRMTAEQVAAVEGAAQIGRYGSLSFIYERNQEEVLAYMLRCPIAAAVYDHQHGIVRDTSAHWESEGYLKAETIALYNEKLATLKNPALKKLSQLVTGARVEFESPIYFAQNGVQIQVKTFTVKRDGRAIRFLPDGYNFLAVIPGFKDKKYTIIS